MGKACSMITGIGLAGALVGLNIYLLMEPMEQQKIKRMTRSICSRHWIFWHREIGKNRRKFLGDISDLT